MSGLVGDALVTASEGACVCVWVCGTLSGYTTELFPYPCLCLRLQWRQRNLCVVLRVFLLLLRRKC